MPAIVAKTHERVAMILLLLAGVFLPLMQLLYNRSLWTDEASVAVSIVHRGFIGLMKPLEYTQVAPILYLWLVKAGSLLIPDSEIGLRLPSYLAYLGTLVLYFLFLRRHLVSGLAVSVGLALFIFNRHILFYATEMKQYMYEAFVSMSLVYIIFSDWDEKRKMVASTLVGCLSVALTISFAMILPAVMLYFLLVRWGRWDRAYLTGVFSMGLAWLVAFVPYYLAFLHNHPYSQVKQSEFAEGFPPSFTDLKGYLQYFFGVASLILRYFGFSGKNLGYQTIPSDWPNFCFMVALVLLGIWRSFQRNRLFLLLLVPVLIHVLVSSLHLYPTANRLFLHAYPIIALLAAMGADALLSARWGSRPAFPAVVYAVLLLFGIVFTRMNFPHRLEEARSVLEGVSRSSKPGDGIFLYPNSILFYDYYTHIGKFRPTGRVVHSRASPSEGWKASVPDLSADNTPFWIFFAHVKPENERGLLDTLGSLDMILNDSLKDIRASAYRVVRKGD
jgi:hypothetical protein